MNSLRDKMGIHALPDKARMFNEIECLRRALRDSVRESREFRMTIDSRINELEREHWKLSEDHWKLSDKHQKLASRRGILGRLRSLKKSQ